MLILSDCLRPNSERYKMLIFLGIVNSSFTHEFVDD